MFDKFVAKEDRGLLVAFTLLAIAFVCIQVFF